MHYSLLYFILRLERLRPFSSISLSLSLSLFKSHIISEFVISLCSPRIPSSVRYLKVSYQHVFPLLSPANHSLSPKPFQQLLSSHPYHLSTSHLVTPLMTALLYFFTRILFFSLAFLPSFHFPISSSTRQSAHTTSRRLYTLPPAVISIKDTNLAKSSNFHVGLSVCRGKIGTTNHCPASCWVLCSGFHGGSLVFREFSSFFKLNF